MTVRHIVTRMLVLAGTGGSALALFAVMIAIPHLFRPEPAQKAPAAGGTVWQLLSPPAGTWVTSTQPITIQAQVTNDLGVKPGPAFYETRAIYGVVSAGQPLVTEVSTQSVILSIAGVTLTEGTASMVTFTAYTSDTNNPQSIQPFTLSQDSIPPAATILSPTSDSRWQYGSIVTITYAATDTTSGISTTAVWFRLAPASTPVLVTLSNSSPVTWTVPVTQSSNAAQVLLRVSDVAGNRSEIASPSFRVNQPITWYAYLPVVALECVNQMSDWCEPNGSPSTAFRLALNYQITASINMTPDRYDYYRVTLAGGIPHTATTQMLPPCAYPTPNCDLDLYLAPVLSPTNYVAKSDASHTGNEQLTYTPTLTSDYLVLVYAFNTTITPTQYTLIVR